MLCRSTSTRPALVCALGVLALTTWFAALVVADETPSGGEVEFFEARIRPVLVERCYECHNSADTAEGGLVVDHRRALLEGGGGGAVVVPGSPTRSRLLAILRHEIEDLEMPQGGPKLADEVIADFKKWIEAGASDPRDRPPSANEVAAATSWGETLDRRKQWWSFQPIQPLVPPTVKDAIWNRHPIDRFIFEKLQAAGLQPMPPTSPSALVRRLYFNLVGLPPSSEDATHWTTRIGHTTGQPRDAVVRELVDHLLDSPRFGERWARHWMDWIRYAESHGSEGDPAVDNAWVYRDYLIRALNADVPYYQLVREHIAGDLLKHPRINEQLGINESMIGPAHWRMVFHGFAPTDALDEKVRFTDDQINAFSKAFLGLTVSCARCHDHKFDAISQKDYYALFGILGSCRPGRNAIDLPERINKNREALAALKPRIRSAIADDWLAHTETLHDQLMAKDGLWKQADKPEHVLHPVYAIRTETAKRIGFDAAWQSQCESYREKSKQWSDHRSRDYLRRWNLGNGDDYANWFSNGVGLPEHPQSAGEFSVSAAGGTVLTGIYPTGVYSHSLSAKHSGRLASADFTVGEENELWVRVIGDSEASLRYVVQNYPRNGTVYPVTKLSDKWRWQRYDLSYWNGDNVHIELATAKDAPLLVKNKPRSWFGIREAVIVRKGQPVPGDSFEHLEPVFEAASAAPPAELHDLAVVYASAMTAAIEAWRDETITNGQALLLDACLHQGLLPNTLDSLGSAKSLLETYRQLEEEIPIPTRVPGLDETIARNQPLYQRGNHKLPGEDVPRRFLEAIDSTPYQTQLSGRRELAEDLLRDDNPLSRRVIVNRVWHHLFGQGIVRTPDNFGRMGEQPSHPELLDWLAARFEDDGWSLKNCIRLIVTSRAWQLSSQPSERSQEADPDNRLLSYANVRRMEAEAIRDSLLAVSGKLDDRLYGPPADGNSPRRSVYVRVIRNSLDPFLRAFDFPEPYSATGRRDVTNVPAQSLTLMNDARVSEYASAWARRVLSDSSLATDEERVRQMFLTAFGRPAEQSEGIRATDYLAETARDFEELRRQLAEIQSQITERHESIARLLEPVRERLLREANDEATHPARIGPQPIGRWEFETTAEDVIGSAHGTLRGGAGIDDGALIVTGGGYVITQSLDTTLKEKTLEAWVQLDNLDQRGGGVMTIQTPDGVYFDSIVFGERAPRQWLAGSNNFARTQSFRGSQESDATNRPVHVAIAYHGDGRIVGFRNRRPYGETYKSNGPYEFRAGNAVIGFGVRHLPAEGDRMLAGRILKAQLYDRALSAEEIAVTSGESANYVSDKQVMAELSTEGRTTVQRQRDEIARLESDQEAMGPVPEVVDEVTVWTDLAQALFTFKEFIYVR